MVERDARDIIADRNMAVQITGSSSFWSRSMLARRPK